MILLINQFDRILLEGKPIPTELRAEATRLQKDLNFDEAQPGTNVFLKFKFFQFCLSVLRL